MADSSSEAPTRPDKAILSLEMRLGILAVLIAIAVIATQGEPSGTKRLAVIGAVVLGIMLDPGRGVRRARENAEAVIVAIILALVIRHYTLEAFEIPTGSMAPGLNGVHVDTTCPNCSTVDSVGISVDQHTNQPNNLTFRQDYLFEGPCRQCSREIVGNASQKGAEIHCPYCDNTVRQDPSHYRSTRFATKGVRCHLCSHDYQAYFEISDVLPGHKILVDKSAYEVGDPERWDVIVFKFNRQRNYIKRLVGLPGETILVRHGDIEIDGDITRKPRHVQAEMWFPIHDSHNVEASLEAAPWQSFPAGEFAEDPSDPDVRLFNALDGVSRMRYVREIRNFYSYNGQKLGSTSPVRDFRARVDVRVNAVDRDKAPRFEIDLRNGEVIYRLSLSFDGQPGKIVRLPRRLGNVPVLLEEERAGDGTDGPRDGWSTFAELPAGSSLGIQRSHEVEFSIADRQLRVVLDGELLLEQHTALADRDIGTGGPGPALAAAYGSPTGNDVSLRARHCGGRIEHVRLDRDIHYTTPSSDSYIHAVNGAPYQIADDGYFAMGDNSPQSLDSRAWGALSRDNLLGKGFAIFWPAWPWRWEVGFID